MNGKSIGIIGFLVGVIATLIFPRLPGVTGAPALAQGGAAGSGQLFGIGGLMADGTGIGVLWVIDPENKQLACYAADSGSKSIRFVGARKMFYDLKLKAINDRTEKYTVDFLAKEYEKFPKK